MCLSYSPVFEAPQLRDEVPAPVQGAFFLFMTRAYLVLQGWAGEGVQLLEMVALVEAACSVISDCRVPVVRPITGVLDSARYSQGSTLVGWCGRGGTGTRKR